MFSHQFNGHEFEQAPGDAEGQGSLACYGPWGRKESDTTERQRRLVIDHCENGLPVRSTAVHFF